MIQSIQDAFILIDQADDLFPYVAIEYLYDHPADPAINEKIVFAIKNATNESVYYDEEMDEFSLAPFCYMMVAEKHLGEWLIEPIIQFLSQEEVVDWEISGEQCAYLVGKLCETMPEIAVPRFFDAIERLCKTETDAPVYYLYEALFYTDLEQYKDRMLQLFKEPDLVGQDVFAQILAARNVPEVVPLLEERLKMLDEKAEELKGKLDEEEAEYAEELFTEIEAMTEELQKGEVDFSKLIEPWSQTRAPWREYLENIEEGEYEDFDDDEEDDFFEDEDEYLAAPDELNTPHDHDYLPYEDLPETVRREHPKVGRNEPCPCGSGKKFKDCHWGKYNPK